MSTYAFGSVVGVSDRHGDRLKSVPMAVIDPPGAPFFLFEAGETSRFPPHPLPAHGPKVRP